MLANVSIDIVDPKTNETEIGALVETFNTNPNGQIIELKDGTKYRLEIYEGPYDGGCYRAFAYIVE